MDTVRARPSEDATIRLEDGRFLGYREYGDRQGKPLFYFHGWPSSRVEAQIWDEPARKAGVRIVSADRPGIALSTFKRGYRIADWPADVTALARELRIDRFPVVGISSGGPYSLACARYLPEVVTAAGTVGGVGPLDVPDPAGFLFKQELQIIGLGRRSPLLARLVFRVMLWRMKRNPDKAMADLMKDMCDADREVMSTPEARDEFVAGLTEMGRQGARGAIHSIVIEGDPWGFALEDVTVPVHIWQGDEDTFCYPAAARYMAGRLPNCKATFCPGEGHFSTIVNRAEEILQTLTAAGG